MEVHALYCDACMVASASMAGVPLMNGFLSKEMFFTETTSPSIVGVFVVVHSSLSHIGWCIRCRLFHHVLFTDVFLTASRLTYQKHRTNASIHARSSGNFSRPVSDSRYFPEFGSGRSFVGGRQRDIKWARPELQPCYLARL